MLPQLLILIYFLWHHPYSKFFKSQESNHPIQQIDLKAAKNLRNTKHTAWLDKDTLLIEGRGDAIVYNVDKDKIELAYSSLPYIEEYYWADCVSKYGAEIIVNTKSDHGRRLSHHFIPNPKNPRQHKLQDRHGHYWPYNDLDCQRYQHTPREEPPSNYLEKQVGYFTHNDLFLTKHDPTKTDLIEFLSSRSGVFFDGHHYLTGSDYDELQNEYLWYQIKKTFDRDPNSERAKWRFWRVTPDLELLETHDLPAGPWIYKRKYYAPCPIHRCPNFDRVKLKSKNGQIFAQVYGRGVKWKHRGIYKLNDDLSAWVPIVTGDTGKDFAVTPDGCKIAFSGYSKSSAGYVNICSP